MNENKNLKLEFITVDSKIESNENKPVVHHINSRRNKVPFDRVEYLKKELRWSLQKYIGKEIYSGIDWQYQGSAQEIEDYLKVSEVEEILNNQIVFDFEYEPNENDFLFIRLEYINEEINKRNRPYIGEYISIIFSNGKWKANEGYDHINKVYQNLKKGLIKYIA